MTILSENLGLAQLSTHAQFRGAKFSKMIQFGVDVSNSSILLEGVMLFSRDLGIEDQEEFMRANGKIQRVSAVADDVGNPSFWMKDGEVHCQMELLASPATPLTRTDPLLLVSSDLHDAQVAHFR